MTRRDDRWEKDDKSLNRRKTEETEKKTQEAIQNNLDHLRAGILAAGNARAEAP
jgi:hypothetical protein